MDQKFADKQPKHVYIADIRRIAIESAFSAVLLDSQIRYEKGSVDPNRSMRFFIFTKCIHLKLNVKTNVERIN